MMTRHGFVVCWSVGARSGGRGRLKSQKAQKEIDEYLTINCELSVHKSMGFPHIGHGMEMTTIYKGPERNMLALSLSTKQS